MLKTNFHKWIDYAIIEDNKIVGLRSDAPSDVRSAYDEYQNKHKYDSKGKIIR